VKKFDLIARQAAPTAVSSPHERGAAAGARPDGPLAVVTVIAFLIASHAICRANPRGGQVVLGDADIVSLGNTTNIDQRTPTAIIDWQRFSIAPRETVNFNQPSALSVTLNRVIGNERSVIAGALNANGKVFIVNSAGILFTKNAQVDVGGLVASTLDISNRNFSAGKMTFSGSSSAAVINRGNIHARSGGYVALLGAEVANEGAIMATLGSVALASGEEVTLNYGGDALLDVTVSKGALEALVENKGVIKADGGRVVMAARAADALLSAQVNNKGVIQARTIAGLMGGAPRSGSVRLSALGGNVHVGGRIDGSAPRSGRGGAIVTRGARVTVARDAIVTTKAASGEHGDWTIASRGFVIGKDGNIGGAQLASLLGSSNIAIRSEGLGREGDIDVESAVRWGADTRLSLDARRKIDIEADIAATGAAGALSMNFGVDYVFGSRARSVSLTGSRASLTINGQSYTLIDTLAELAALSRDPDAIASGFYALGRDIDASGASFDGPVVSALDGTLAGLGHKVRNLTIMDPDGLRADAMIGVAGATATIRDIGLINANIFAGDYLARSGEGAAAALVNENNGVIANASVEGGVIAGVGNVGGLVAINNGTIVNSISDIEVNGRSAIGGLVGVNGLFGSIIGSAAYGPIFAGAPLVFNADLSISLDDSLYIGGLVGLNGGLVTRSHADAAITTLNSSNVGGLVGDNVNIGFGLPGGEISYSYATGWINATWNSRLTLGDTAIGGLVGQNDGGTIIGGRSKIDISLTNQAGLFTPSAGAGGFFVPMTGIGGLVGVNKTAADETGGVIRRSTSLTNIYNDGWVDAVGGLVGNAYGGSITDSFAAGMVTSGVYVFPNGAAGLIGNVFNSDLVSLGGNGWDINGTGQTAGVGFGGSGMSGVTGVGNPNLPPPFGFPTPVDPSAGVSRQTRLAAAQIGTTIGTTNTSIAAATPARERLASAGTAATSALSDASLEERTTLEEAPPPSRVAPPIRSASLGRASLRPGAQPDDLGGRRRDAKRPAPKATAQKRQDPGYGAVIRSIEIDGKRFDLQEAPAGAGKPER
jgi:filamentous hemagglutinin family protein